MTNQERSCEKSDKLTCEKSDLILFVFPVQNILVTEHVLPFAENCQIWRNLVTLKSTEVPKIVTDRNSDLSWRLFCRKTSRLVLGTTLLWTGVFPTQQKSTSVNLPCTYGFWFRTNLSSTGEWIIDNRRTKHFIGQRIWSEWIYTLWAALCIIQTFKV